MQSHLSNITLTTYALVGLHSERAQVVFCFMINYIIKSPSGKQFKVKAETIYHAVQIVVSVESFKFSNVEYLKLNK